LCRSNHGRIATTAPSMCMACERVNGSVSVGSARVPSFAARACVQDLPSAVLRRARLCV
jgi:hypothetical protein